MKIVVMNDRKTPIVLRLIDDDFDVSNPDPSYLGSLAPAESRVIDVNVPEGHVLYIKDWETMKLISTFPENQLIQFAETVRIKL